MAAILCRKAEGVLTAGLPRAAGKLPFSFFSSEETPYPSLPRKRESSSIPFFLLSPQNPSISRGPQEKGKKKEDHIGKTKGFPYDPFLYKGVATPLRPQGRPVRVCIPRGHFYVPFRASARRPFPEGLHLDVARSPERKNTPMCYSWHAEAKGAHRRFFEQIFLSGSPGESEGRSPLFLERVQGEPFPKGSPCAISS